MALIATPAYTYACPVPIQRFAISNNLAVCYSSSLAAGVSKRARLCVLGQQVRQAIFFVVCRSSGGSRQAAKKDRLPHWSANCNEKGMPEEKNEQLLNTEEYAPQRYSKRASAMTTLKIMLLGGGALGALWLLDSLAMQ
ncbi:MAG: hypothetical protein ACRD6B_24865 [Bryobacteraceae bacterium]